MKAEELGYIEELLGHWEIRYPGPDGMIVADYIESLELRIDGTFSWHPTPLWAKQNGRWGVTVDEESGQIRLYFEERNGGTYRGNWLVLAAVPLGGHSVPVRMPVPHSIVGSRAACALTSSCACWPTTSSGICARCGASCSSPMRTRRPRPIATRWHRQSAPRPPRKMPPRTRASTAHPFTASAPCSKNSPRSCAIPAACSAPPHPRPPSSPSPHPRHCSGVPSN